MITKLFLLLIMSHLSSTQNFFILINLIQAIFQFILPHISIMIMKNSISENLWRKSEKMLGFSLNNLVKAIFSKRIKLMTKTKAITLMEFQIWHLVMVSFSLLTWIINTVIKYGTVYVITSIILQDTLGIEIF